MGTRRFLSGNGNERIMTVLKFLLLYFGSLNIVITCLLNGEGWAVWSMMKRFLASPISK